MERIKIPIEINNNFMIEIKSCKNEYESLVYNSLFIKVLVILIMDRPFL